MLTHERVQSLANCGLSTRRLSLLSLAALLAAQTTHAQAPHGQTTGPALVGVPAPPSVLAANAGTGRAPNACLPAEIRDLVLRSGSRRRDIETCELACLPRPAGLDPDDAARLQRRHAIQWCRECVPITPGMTTDEVRKLEQEGGLAGCPRPQRPEPTAARPGGFVMTELRGVRALFGAGRPAPAHNHLAVVIGNGRKSGQSIGRPRARADAEAIAVLLVERLGYRHANLIELRDADGRDLDRLFGDGVNNKGVLADRLAQSPGAEVFIYMSGSGTQGIAGTAEGAYLVAPANAASSSTPNGAPGNAARVETGYPLARFYQRLADLKSNSVVVVLEMAFGQAPGTGLNAPATDVPTLPPALRRGLAVITSAERDQTPLDDAVTGLSLFTRHLVEGLAGAADRPPAGNGDGVIDTTEAFAYAAGHTMLQARKLHHQLQRPVLSQIKPALLPGTRAP